MSTSTPLLPLGSHGTGDLLTLSEVAALLRTPAATLRYWRYLGDRGPASLKVGRRVMYLRADVEAYLSACRTRPDAVVLRGAVQPETAQ